MFYAHSSRQNTKEQENVTDQEADVNDIPESGVPESPTIIPESAPTDISSLVLDDAVGCVEKQEEASPKRLIRSKRLGRTFHVSLSAFL